MPVESSAVEFGLTRAVENAAKPENQGTPAQEFFAQKLDERPLTEKLADEIAVVSSRLAGEGLSRSSDSMRVASNLNVEAIRRYHGELLSRARTPTEAMAVQAEADALDPSRPVVKNGVTRLVKQSSGLWVERPDDLNFIDVNPNPKFFRHANNSEMVNVGGYWVNQETASALVENRLAKYHPWVDMQRGVITLPVVGAQVWNSQEQKFQAAFPDAVGCFSMPYYKFLELQNELDNPRQNRVPTRAAVQPVNPPTPEAAPAKNPAEVAAEFKNYIFNGGRLIKQGKYAEAMVYFKNKEELAKAGGYLSPARGRMLTHVPRPDEIAELANVIARNSWYRDSGAILLPTLRMNDPSQMQSMPKELQHEVALVRMEEWLHRLQDLQEKPVAGQTDPEVDVAFYMANNGIPMTEAFKQRYDRGEALEKAKLRT